MTIPVAIDTDPGVDDSIALMLAMRSPEIEIVLITTVAGNVPVRVGTRNAKRLVGLVNPKRWPLIAEGSPAPLERPLTTAAHVRGRDGLGGNAGKYAVPRGLPTRTDGVEQLVEFARQHGPRGVLVALGPLTNVALAIQTAPRAMSRLGRLVIMGGAIRVPGNVGPVAEFNIFVDPEAADLVLGFGLDALLIPLDVTRQVVLSESRIAQLGRGRLALAAKRFTLRVAREFGGMPMHDSLAVAAAIDPALVGTETLSVRVETRGARTLGMTVADLRGSVARNTEPTIAVATSVKTDEMLSMLEERVFAGEARSRSWRHEALDPSSAPSSQ